MTDTICDNIKTITKEKELRLGSVERSAGVSEGYLSRCKSGKCQLTVDVARKFAEVLLVPFDDLIRDRKKRAAEKPTDSTELHQVSSRPKSEQYVCISCGEFCYYPHCKNGIQYRFCPNCGKVVRGYA